AFVGGVERQGGIVEIGGTTIDVGYGAAVGDGGVAAEGVVGQVHRSVKVEQRPAVDSAVVGEAAVGHSQRPAGVNGPAVVQQTCGRGQGVVAVEGDVVHRHAR